MIALSSCGTGCTEPGIASVSTDVPAVVAEPVVAVLVAAPAVGPAVVVGPVGLVGLVVGPVVVVVVAAAAVVVVVVVVPRFETH